MQKVILAADHAAFDAKEKLKNYLIHQKYEVIDVGTYSSDRCDYPLFTKKLVFEVKKYFAQGILLCGSGIGVSMAANKYKGIRAALCRTANDAEMARKHNNANVLCLGARVSSEEEIKKITEAFFQNYFEGGRHLERVAMFQDMGEN